jgi:hypothetical protein
MLRRRIAAYEDHQHDERYKELFREKYLSCRDYVIASTPRPKKTIALLFQRETRSILVAAGITHMLYVTSQVYLYEHLQGSYGCTEPQIIISYGLIFLSSYLSSKIQRIILHASTT